MSLNQPIENSINEQTVGVKVDFAISKEKISQPLSVLLKKGNLGKSIVRIFIIEENKNKLIKEIIHIGEIPGSEGLNPLSFEIDFKFIKSISSQIQINRPTKKMIWAFYYPWYYKDS